MLGNRYTVLEPCTNFPLIFFSDEVRSSLNFLDSVIGEFDDGLISAAESDYTTQNGGGGEHRGGRRSQMSVITVEDDRSIAPEIRKRPPPKNKDLSPRPHSSGISLTDKIDDIFSELTEEIYSADKQQKIISKRSRNSNGKPESFSSSNSGRQLSPVRRVTDPLPTPPVDSQISR